MSSFTFFVCFLTCQPDNLELTEMNSKMDALLMISAKLVGLSSVLEVLNMTFKDTQSATLDDLHQLQESIVKTKQVYM